MKVLLVEPNYKNKYLPIGLMKIATYHKMKGDEVHFYKGSIDALKMQMFIEKYDRAYVTTLFSFYADITINTINAVKQCMANPSDIMVGGILATLQPELIEKKTGIKPFTNQLDRAGILGDDDIIVDTLPLDYSILSQISYKYPTEDAFIGYASRGCVNKCKFCAVPTLEPKYNDNINIKSQIIETERMNGKKNRLLLLDNNILASSNLRRIVDDIKEAGYTKESKRIVDFNQGLDARLVTPDKIKILLELPLKPIRIAFDSWAYKDIYERAIRICADAGASYFTNYMLYNFKDDPIEFYKRIELNVLLSKELKISLSSFPMKYIPLTSEDSYNRKYIGDKWNKRALRIVKVMLNSFKGIARLDEETFRYIYGDNTRDFLTRLDMDEASFLKKYSKKNK